MTIRRSRAQSLRSESLRRQQRDRARRQTLRALQVETLEERRLLASHLELIGIQPNGDEFLQDGDVRHTAPTNLRFVFSGNQSIDPNSLGGIRITRAGGDGVFGDANDVIIQPGYVGVGDNTNEVLLRFAEHLPDDQYRIDVLGSGSTPLRNTQGAAFHGGVDQRIQFRLDLGAQVIAVVPQPIEQQPDGSMAQYRDQIRVYFTDDDLYVPDAENPALYQLIYTGDTARNTDDVVFHPDSVSYDAGTDMAVLTFADDIHLLVNPATGLPVGAGTFRLRIGTDEPLPPAPHVIKPSDDIGSSYDSAWDLGVLGGQSQLVATRIDAQAYLLDFPGGNDEPGHREIPEETAGGYDNHLNPLFGADNVPGISTVLYNFQADYGLDDQGLPLKNLITQTQKERAREAFEVWGEYIGVQFLETSNQGLTIVTGDPHALDPYAPNVVNHTLVKPDVNAHFMVRVDPEYQDSLLILDNANQWNDEFGADWYRTAMIGIGFMLGLERASDLPSSTLMAFAADFSFPGSRDPEPIFPGNHDILHGSYLHRPDSNDIDLYRFEIAAGQQGVFTAETFAERQPNSSLLDTLLILYRENADGSRSVVARNDDYYSEDSFIELRLGTGTYFLGVSASGNDQYNPEFEDTGFGGMSQGPYDLRVDFRPDPEPGKALRDVTAQGTPGTPLDGDADGTPGGAYNFWFRAAAPAQTILVDKMNRAFEAGTKGTYRTISSALTASVPGDIVRIVGNGGSDNDFATLRNNRAYEIGPGPLPNQVLADGKTLDVPKGVTIMVDAGAIFKMNQSRIGVGSASLSVDRSGSAFQVLGTPDLPVYFTSYFDESIGLDTYLPTTTPSPGHWGGIVYRNDFDNAEQRFSYEREGTFLNYVNHADVRYGGGNVVIEALKQIVTPIQMTEARPTISFNRITHSADAPISADPNSFEETNFHAPKFQLKGLFTSDYQRVGPDIHDNLLVENSSNGLFVRILTPAGDAQKSLTVPGRFDDTDIVHILSENLRIQGTSGEPILELVRPPVNLVTVAARSGGSMEQLTYRYKVVYVDANGFEGRPSEATGAVTLSGSNRSVRLDKLPAATGDFVARRIYRSSTGIAGPYVFVDQINTSDAVYLDTKSLSALDPNNTLQRDIPTVQGVTLAPSTVAGSLEAGSYNYRLTYFNSAGATESPSSDPTVTRVLNATGRIQMNGIVRPHASSGFDLIRIYRSGSDGKGPYRLVGEIPATDTSYLDEGAEPGVTLSPELFGVARARPDARLAIDPGIVVKLEGSRIETTFGAQMIAEGLPGREIIFTSRSDDRFGAGGTFDTNGDGRAATPGPGNWGGIYVGTLGSASIDHALLTFGGGVTKIEGTFKAFNILEIHQGDLRLAHSVVEYNANGQAGQGPANRFGRGYNEPATIFVRGAQPILLDNIIQHNDEVAITINANSFTAEPLPDIGRSTGPISQATSYSANVGPLIRGNRMIDNPLNAVDIRGEVLTTQSVWDDTDIVHVLRNNLIIVPDFHSNVGLRLQSSPSASLVVKMAGPGDNFDPALGAGFTATGRQLDIDDRIGGTMHIIGQPDFPVILTSLSDDTVGAGLQPNGEILTDTNDDGLSSLPKAGDWRSVRLEQFANDRNVELVIETESPTAVAPGDNATPASAQHLGELAPFEFAGDDNLRLGFDVRGILNQRNDIDVYSFEAAAGTEVWLDIDRTTNTLNSVVELVDASGNVMARSDDSLAESIDRSLLYRSAAIDATAVNPLQKAADEYQPRNASGLPKDFYSLNIYDAGMRVVLPGVVGVRSTYHVRVRSSSNDLDDVNGGLTTGSYQLQVRLRETDEVAGVTVRYADVRYATNGIELFGLPGHSPLLGEVAEDEQVGGPENNGQVMPGPVPGTGPQDIGNLFRSDRAVISIAGTIRSLDDLDFYEMQIAYEATAGSLFQHAPVVFDVDYASGLSRPDTIVSVFDSFGRLVLIGRNSNITDDRGGALDEGDLSDLSRGSLGALDPFIGPVELPEATYFVAVSSNARIPTQLLSNPDLRLEPVNTITRVAEDHIGSSGGSTAGAPQVPVLLDQSSIIAQSPSSLTIVILHDTGNPDEVLLSAAGLTSGAVTRTIGPYPGKVHDLATRHGSDTYAFSTPDEDPAATDATTGILRGVNISSPQFIASRDDGIETYMADPRAPGVAIRANVGIRFHAVTYGILGGQERLFAVGSRGDADTPPAGPTRFTNLLYQFDPDTGRAISAPQTNRVGSARMQGAGTQIVERGELDTNSGGGPGGQINGLAIHDGKLYALSDTGGLFLVRDPLSPNASLVYIADIIPNSGVIQEIETNNSLADAQDLDLAAWTKRYDPNIGDMDANTSTDIRHITVHGTGDDAFVGNFIKGESGGLDGPTGSVFRVDPGTGRLYFYVASGVTNEVLRYDGLTGEFIDVFVDSGSGGLNGPREILFGPDGNLYVASLGTDAILRYDGTTGAFRDFFVTPGAGGLDQPTGMLFHTDGNLYVASGGTHEVIRFNGSNGRFMNVFVSARDGGLTNPYGLTFGADGKLYVNSFGSNSVLRYDGTTGFFDQEFIPSGSGGLNGPRLGLRFGPDGHLYVASANSDRVIRYHSQSGAVLDAYVPPGADSLRNPWGLLFGPDGKLYVNSFGNDRVLVYNNDRIAASWQWQAELPLAADVSANDAAGSGVAIDGDTMIVGAPLDDPSGMVDAGSVYVYVRDRNGTPDDLRDDIWTLHSRLQASDAASGDQFGTSVALDGDVLVVGAWTEDETPGVVAAATLATEFSATGEMSSQNDAYNGFQLRFTSGALVGQVATIADYVGATRTFVLAAALPGVPAAGDRFDITVPNAGSAYVFRYDGAAWNQEAKLKVRDPRPGRMLGAELAISADAQGDTIVAGAPREIVGASTVTTAAPQAGQFAGGLNLSATDDFYNGFYLRFESGPLAGQARQVTDYVGNTRTFTFAPTFTVAPATGNSFEILPADSGSAYIFRYDGANWFEQTKLVPSDSTLLDMFGRGVDVDGGTVLVGAPNGGAGFGSAYRYDRNDGGTADPTDDTWAQTLRWQPRDGAMNDKFGWAVALEGDRSVVTALRDDDGALNSGSAYVYLWENSAWTEVIKLRAPDAGANDQFGASIALEGNRVLIGAPDGDVGVVNSGSAYLFEVTDPQNTPLDPFDDQWLMVVEVAASHASVEAPLTDPLFDAFGTSVGLSNDTFVVGDPHHNFRGLNSGTAQVFVLGDLSQATFETFFVPRGTGGLADPRQMILGPDGLLYVASATSDRILRYDGETGNFIDVFVTSGSGGLDEPEGLAFGPDLNGDDTPELYVTSRRTDEVLIYNGADGTSLGGFFALGVLEPTGLVFADKSGDGVPELYVSGFASDNVVQYNFDAVNGTFAFHRHLVPPGRGGLDGPIGLSFLSDGRLYVASSNTDSILRYNGTTGAFGGDFIPTGRGGLDEPHYFAVGPDANADGDAELYVTSFANDSVLRYNARTGAFVDAFVYSGNEGLDGPTGLLFTADGHLIVASSLTDAVMEFDTSGKPTFDFFKFTVENDGDRGIFDIDFAMKEGDPGSFNAEIFILDASGAVLFSNNDENVRYGAEGSEDAADPYLEVVFATAGVYYVMIGEFDSDVANGAGTGNRPDLTDTYTLHVSIENYRGNSFEGLAVEMQQGAGTEGTFFAVNRQGELFAFTTDDTALTDEPFFDNGLSRISTGIEDVMGIALTTSNLWHMSTARRDDKGHGLTNVFDDSRGNASVVRERESNDTPATAHDLELEFWSLGYDSNIGDTQDPPVNTSTTIPHVTIKGSGDGTFDFYSFVVTTVPARGIFDIDMDFDEQLDPHGFMDAEIILTDQYGNVITWLEDATLPTDGDGGNEFLFDPPLEPTLEYIFTVPGTYMVAVTKFVDPFIWQPPEEGDFYTLQVSIENHRVDGPATDAGLSFFFGPELTGLVTGAVAGDPVLITSPGHGLLGGERVDVQGVLGIPGANGTFTVSVADDDSFELTGSDATGVYQGGGTWRLLQIPEDVQGSILTHPFSLLGYSADDLPVLYFNYLLDADAAADIDMASVSIVEGNGIPQPLLVKGGGLINSVPGTTPLWRQARVELGDYADKENLRLLFTFESADSVSSSFEGLLIDDIIIGFAERGEMVSYAYNDPTFTINPDSVTTDALTGPYQLEIRPASDPGPSQRPTAQQPNSQQLTKTWDTNERFTQQTSLVPPAGSEIADGETFTISDGIKRLTFEYDDDGSVAEGNVQVPFEAGDTAQQVGWSIRDAINSLDVQLTIGVTATVSAATLRGTNFADGTTPTDPLYQLVDLAGTAIVTGIQHLMYDGIGDVNRFRDQGQVIIHSNFVTDSRDFGIVADAGTRDVEPRLLTAFLQPHAGAARNLRELNNQPAGGLAPGAVIENNVIANEGLGGIHVSGNIAPFEIVPPTDTTAFLSGQFVRDGQTFTVHAYRTDVTFEFEDISGGAVPAGGSGVQGGNGWRAGNIPIFYRQSGSNYLAPPWVIPPRPYNQAEMATAIRDAIQSSILVTNGTTLHANVSLETSRMLRSAIVPDNALYGPPLVSVYLDNVSAVDLPTNLAVSTRRDPNNPQNEIPVSLGQSVQPFHRVLNNTVFGNDGTQAFYPGTGLSEPNDRMSTAVETWQGRQHNPAVFSSDGIIGDGSETLNDASLDVDFYRFQLAIGERVTIDMSTEKTVLVNDPTVDPFNSSNSQSETTLVVLGNRILVGYNDSGSQVAGNKFTGYALSVDGGRTFTDMGELPNSPNDDSGDPVLARDEVSGTIYFATLTNANGPIQVFRSYDEGESFGAPVVATPGKTGFQDKPWMAVDNFAGPGQGNVYVTATDFSGSVNNGIYFFRSTNGGNSYGPTGGTLIAGGAGVQGSWVTVDPNHTVYVFYYDGSAAPQTIKMRKSFDYGATFSSAVTVATLNTTTVNGDLGLTRSNTNPAIFRTNAFPQVVVNPINGHLYMTYNDDPTGTDKSDVYFISSSNGGLTWTAPRRVNDDGSRNDQWQPAIAVTPDGKSVGVFWYDRRLSPTNSKIDYFGRIGTATAAGVAFLSPSFRINDQSFDAVFGADPLLNPTYMGDYDQAQADNEAFYVVWADNGLGTPDVRFARVPLTGQQNAVDPVLRLFNNRGEELAIARGINGTVDFTATSAGTYYVGVSGRGNETYDPLSLGNRTGPASVGSYRIEIDVIAPRTWVITAQDGTQVQDGTTFTVSDINDTVTYEFDDVNAPGVTAGNIPIVYDSRPVQPQGFNHRGPGYRAPEMAVAMANTIGQGLTGVTAVALGGFQGASGALPPQIPAIQGDTSVYGFPGFGHDSPYTPPRSTGELYVVISGASRIEGSVLFRPMLRENIDQLLPETGILVSDRSSPTLLNNVLSNLNAGIWQDASPTTVVGGSLYQHNDQADSNIGGTNDDFNVSLGNFDRLFVNSGDRNFYPAPLSRMIDSAIDSLEDRVRYATVKDAVGIPVSTILAPDLDAAGLLRSDDPEVETPSGQGANVFKDRGGLDRADFVGPDAILIVPQDNDAAGLDLDPTDTIVQLSAGRYDKFTIQLVDGLQSSTSGEGVGVDDLTVGASKITLTADGQLLTENVDYSFRYNPTTNIISLTPLGGAWDNNKAYVISLPNEDRFVIEMPHGGQVSDGEMFVITDNTDTTVTFEFESGYSLLVPETLKLFVPTVGKGPGGIEDGQRFTVSTGINQYTFEYDANTPPSFLPGNTPINIAGISSQDEVALATVNALIARNIGVTPVYLGNGVIHFGAPGTYSVNTALSTLTQSGEPGVVADGHTISISDGVLPIKIFEFDSNGSVPLGRIPITFSAASTQDDITASIATAIIGSGVGLTPANLGEGHLHLGGTPSHRVVVTGSPKLSLQGKPGVQPSTTLVVPPQAAGVGGIADGQWFSIQNRPNDPVVFEFDNNGIVSPGARAILFTPTSTVDQLSGFIISAINLANLGLTPTYLGTGQIALRDTIHHKTNTLNTKVDQFGVAGGVVQVNFVPDDSFSTEDAASLILDAIDQSLLTGVTTTFRGGNTFFINGIKSISGLQNFFISSIRDKAGNSLQPNQASNQTYFTILMPGVQFDFGDAPESYGTLFADDGARHVISDNPLLLGFSATTESDGLPSLDAKADEDDGVDLTQSVFNQYIDTPITVTATGRGFLDVWIDFNRDGDWNDPGEQVVISQPVVAGTNELVIQTLATAQAGETYARFRISRLGGLTPTGVATDGEVEDYRIRIEQGIPPVATNDSGFVTDESTPLPIDPVTLLANDFDLDTPHGQLTVLRLSATSTLGATLSWDLSGNVVYDPRTSPQLQALNPGERLIDTFQYQATDGVLPSNWATVSVTVNGVNNAPVAIPDDYATNEDAILNVAASGVLGNDYDPDLNDSISVSGHDLLSVMGAAITMSANGGFTYNPTQAAAVQALAAGATATDTFTYTIVDAGGLTSSAVVSIALTGLNDAPVGINDALTVDEDTLLMVGAPGVLDNDVDIDGDPLSVFGADTSSALGAPVTVNADGSLSYDPRGVDVLQDLAVGATMTDTFTYTVVDSSGLQDTATVIVTVEGRNDAPDPSNDAYATDEDKVLVVIGPGVLANDVDRDGDSIEVDVANTDTISAMGATVAASADGGFTYDPRDAALIRDLLPGQSAFDTFTYTMVDVHGGTATATVTVRVAGVNSAPVVTDKTYATDEDTLLSDPAPGVLDGDYDPDGQNIQISNYDATSTLGAVVTVNADGSFSYDPKTSTVLQALNVGGSLTDTFTYTVVDDDVNAKSATGTISVVVTGVNDAPVATNDSMLVARNAPSTLNVLANDTDIDGTFDVSTVTVQTNPSHGTATVLADGTIRYVPAADYSGDDVLTYTVRDNNGAVSNAATVSLRVNAAPVAENDVVQAFKNVPVTISVLANDRDVDGTLDPSSVTIVTQPLRGAAAITANGRVVYTPNTNYVGNDSFTYTVRDNHGVVSNTATVSISVAVDPFPWQNPNNALDVNNDGNVSPIDALLLISDINRKGARDLPNPPVAPNVPPPYLDVSGDNRISSIDALLVITYLNTPQGEGEAEGEGEASSMSHTPAVEFTTGRFVPLLATANGSQTYGALSGSRSQGQAAESDTQQDFALRIGQVEEVRRAALNSFLASSALDEALEELVAGRQAGQDEDLLEDQALIDLLFD